LMMMNFNQHFVVRYGYVRLDGSMTIKKRYNIVERIV
jgi:SNF2 family DNA or RNA helicase